MWAVILGGPQRPILLLSEVIELEDTILCWDLSCTRCKVPSPDMHRASTVVQSLGKHVSKISFLHDYAKADPKAWLATCRTDSPIPLCLWAALQQIAMTGSGTVDRHEQVS